MKWLGRGLKAAFNFLVGDGVLLAGVVLLFLAAGALRIWHHAAFLRGAVPALFVVGVLVTLAGALVREIRPKD